MQNLLAPLHPPMTPLHSTMLIGGEWVESSGGERDEIINPANGEIIGSVPRGTVEDVDRAVAAAKRALPGWLETTPAERSYLLHEVANRVDQNAEVLGRIESLNAGKPLIQAMVQVGYFTEMLRFMAGAARNLEGLSAGEYTRGYTSYIRREPLGICAGIVPWNYPLPMASWKLSPALAAGNVQILKPSELTPLSILKVAEIIDGILPPGVLQIVTGDAVVGSRLVDHPDVDFVSVTGSVATGRKVAAAGGAALKRVHLELGGNHPVLIFDDADLSQAGEIFKNASFFNNGQDCEAAARFIVAPNKYDEFVALMVDVVKSFQVGDPSRTLDVDLGSVISKREQTRVLGLLERAEANGATVLAGGDTLDPRGAFITPAVVTNLKQTDEIVREEIFGPAITIQRFNDDEQAYSWANATRNRLAATVFTENHGRAMDATRRLDFGKVWVNDSLVGASEFPHGGFSDTGGAQDGSKYGFEAYTKVKAVTHRGGRKTSFWTEELPASFAAIREQLGQSANNA